MRLCILALVGMMFAGAANAACIEDTVELRGDWGRARFSVEIADDEAERSRGLMFREEMASSSGMLFIYPQPKHATFWMRNTLIPLDMLFVDRTGVVSRVHANAIPHDETPIDGGEGVLVVLEINGGMAEKLGITAGSEMRHPVFDQKTANWPCDEN